MLTATPQIDVDDVTPVTKTELDIQLKRLNAQIKKDVHHELSLIVNKGGGLSKMVEEVMTKAMENMTSKVMENMTSKVMSSIVVPEQIRRAKAADIRRKQKKTQDQQTQRKAQALKGSASQINMRSRTNASLDFTLSDGQATRSTNAYNSLQQETEMASMGTGLVVSEIDGSLQITPGRSQSRDLQTGSFWISIERLVLSPYFEYGIAIMLILNLIQIGFETQMQSSHSDQYEVGTRISSSLDTFFCVVFTIELALRIFVYREYLWSNAYLFHSTAFDAVMVTLQIVDQVVYACSLNVHALSVLRIVRVARIIRLLHLFDELSALIAGMTRSVESMLWTVFLLGILMYMFSIVFMQILITTGDMHTNEKFIQWFGTVDRAIYTMFEIILGGLNWNEVLQALTYEVSPLMGPALICYIITTLFFLMNLVCGVFVDRVTRTVREDKDEKQANKLSEIFTKGGENGEEVEVTLEDFTEKLSNDDIQAYFTSIDVNPDRENAKGLFELIDYDGSGQLNAAEIVSGCLRLRGPAKALEVALLSKDVAQLSRQTAANLQASENSTKEIKNLIRMIKTMNETEKELVQNVQAMTSIVADEPTDPENSEPER